MAKQADESLVIEASINDAMTEQLARLAQAVEQFSKQASGAMELVNKSTVKTTEVTTKLSGVSEILSRRFASLGKSAVSLFTADLLTRALGFGSIMQTMAIASEKMGNAINDTIFPGLRRAQEEAKKLADELQRVRDAQSDAAYTQTISARLGTDPTAVNLRRLFELDQGRYLQALEAIQANNERTTSVDRGRQFSANPFAWATDMELNRAARDNTLAIIRDLEKQAERSAEYYRIHKAGIESQKRATTELADVRAKADDEWLARLRAGQEIISGRRSDAAAARFFGQFVNFGAQAGQLAFGAYEQQQAADARSARLLDGSRRLTEQRAQAAREEIEKRNAFFAEETMVSLEGTGFARDLGAMAASSRFGTNAQRSARDLYLDSMSQNYARSLSFSLEDAIMREDFSDLGRTFADQTKLALIQGFITDPLSNTISGLARNAFSALGFGSVVTQAKGGVWQGGINSFATGGVAYGPQLAMIGDNRSQTEAIVPMPDGRSIPVTMRGAGSGGAGAQVTININALDGASVMSVMPQIEARLAASIRGGNRNLQMAVRGA